MKYLIILVIVVLTLYVYKRHNTTSKAQLQANITAGNAFLAENIQAADVIETESGLQYKITQSVNNDNELLIRPNKNSTVTVHYQGTLIDGTVFDSSIKRGQPISFRLNQVIPGWTEGLQLMAVGEKIQLFIPSKLAYGDKHVGKIPGGSLLIFDVELLAVEN